MTDCIDRNRAIFECERLFKEDKEAQEQCMSLLSMLPSVDAVPVVHGKWVKDEDSCHYDYYLPYFDFNCSICGEIENDQHGLPNYCPNCGAKMEVQ